MRSSYQVLSTYYDRFTEDVGYAQWADDMMALFAREQVHPGLVLDLACGTGRMTKLLAERGCEMIGVDASPDMLMQAMQNTMDCTPRPLYLNQRMQDLDLYGTVEVCICCLDSINYMTDPAALAQAFYKVHLFLEPKVGLFVFDVNTPEKFARLDGNSYICEEEGVFCAWQAAVEDGLCAYQFDIFEQQGAVWTRTQEVHEQRIYPRDTLIAMLEQAGFSEIRCYADLRQTPVRGGEDRIFFTARRRDG